MMQCLDLFNWRFGTTQLIWLLAILSLVSMTAAFGAHADAYRLKIATGLRDSQSYRVRYFDPEISRSTIYDVPKIASNGVDFDVRAKCQFYSCEHATHFLGAWLLQAKESGKPCFGPPYLRVEFFGPDVKRILLQMDVDSTGRCMMFKGKPFVLPNDLRWKLHSSRISAW